MSFTWKESTRNHHILVLDGMHVAAVVRPQKHRADGTKHDWQVEIFGSRHFNKMLCQHDPRDLESTKSAAEACAKWAIESLYRALRAKSAKKRSR